MLGRIRPALRIQHQLGCGRRALAGVIGAFGCRRCRQARGAGAVAGIVGIGLRLRRPAGRGTGRIAGRRRAVGRSDRRQVRRGRAVAGLIGIGLRLGRPAGCRGRAVAGGRRALRCSDRVKFGLIGPFDHAIEKSLRRAEGRPDIGNVAPDLRSPVQSLLHHRECQIAQIVDEVLHGSRRQRADEARHQRPGRHRVQHDPFADHAELADILHADLIGGLRLQARHCHPRRGNRIGAEHHPAFVGFRLLVPGFTVCRVQRGPELHDEGLGRHVVGIRTHDHAGLIAGACNGGKCADLRRVDSIDVRRCQRGRLRRGRVLSQGKGVLALGLGHEGDLHDVLLRIELALHAQAFHPVQQEAGFVDGEHIARLDLRHIGFQGHPAADRLAAVDDIVGGQLGGLVRVAAAGLDRHIGVIDPTLAARTVGRDIGANAHRRLGHHLPVVAFHRTARNDRVQPVQHVGADFDLERARRVGCRDIHDRGARRADDTADLAALAGIAASASLQEGQQHLVLVVLGRGIGRDHPAIGVANVGAFHIGRHVDAGHRLADAAHQLAVLVIAQAPFQRVQQRVVRPHPRRRIGQTAAAGPARIRAVLARVPAVKPFQDGQHFRLAAGPAVALLVHRHGDHGGGLAGELVGRTPPRHCAADGRVALVAGRAQRRGRLGAQAEFTPEDIVPCAGGLAAIGTGERHALAVGGDRADGFVGPGPAKHGDDRLIPVVLAPLIPVHDRAGNTAAAGDEVDGGVRIRAPVGRAAGGVDLGREDRRCRRTDADLHRDDGCGLRQRGSSSRHSRKRARHIGDDCGNAGRDRISHG